MHHQSLPSQFSSSNENGISRQSNGLFAMWYPVFAMFVTSVKLTCQCEVHVT